MQNLFLEKYFYTRSVVVAVLLGLFFTASMVHGQQTKELVAEDMLPEIVDEVLPEAPIGTVSCFDYYTFGSVQVQVSSQVSSTVSGTPITFTGQITNNNPYPIVQGSVFVKIFKRRTAEKNANGPDVVDQFFALNDVTIPANGSVPITITWQVPSTAQSGEYQLASFFTSSRKFNLLGLSFTDDVAGTTSSFNVIGEQKTGVQFDKEGSTVDGKPYFFAVFPPHTTPDKPVVVTGSIKNTTDKKQIATLAWTAYQWDAQLRENVLLEKTETVEIPAKSSKVVSVTVTNTQYPVYLVVGELRWQDSKSIIGVRFVRGGKDKIRINFPSITSFPLVAGQENTLFSCLHNSGEAHIVSGGTLELTLSDFAGNVIHEYVYKGDVTGAMMGVAEKFIPKKSYDRFKLDARLYQNGLFIDEANLVYDCSLIDPENCSVETMGEGGDASADAQINANIAFGSNLMQILVLIVLATLLIFGIAWRVLVTKRE